MANKDKTSAEPNSVAQVSERVRNSSNILVALSKDPSIDELTAALSLALILDKFGKHATAIFSGTTPNIISFLQPEKTFETDTNSLQDFIIALDKEKADHIRYKIDGDFVKVFITPYKTTIDEKDLEFSHGDFNVDLVIALNVKSEAELDSALVEYGRIMHDASSINISPAAPGNFGDIEWGDPMASSVSEMIYRLAIDLQDPSAPLIDDNIATTILTGVISATNRFSNERTTADTLSVASNLLASGANQQLIAKNIPVDILTAQPEPEAPAEAPVETPAEAPAEPEAEPVVEPVAEPVVEVPAAPVDPTNFSIEHQKKDDLKPKEEKAEKEESKAEGFRNEKVIEPLSEPKPEESKAEEAPKADALEAPNAEPAKTDAKSETARIVEQAQQKQADEKAKAEAEEKRKKEEQAAKDKAEAEKNQAAKEAIVARVKAEHSKQDKPEAVLPPQPPKDFAAKLAEPKAEAPKAAEVAEAPKAAPETPKSEPGEPTVIPNAIPTDGAVLPPPPAPSTESVMPPAVSAAPTPATTAPATTPAAVPSEPTVIPNAVATAPVMPSVTMPSQESVARAMNPAATTAQTAPTQSAQAPAATTAPAAPTLAPRPAVTPTSPVATATPAQAPAQPAAPAANPINDPGAFHIPGM